MSLFEREPVIIINAVTAFVTALITLAVAFGFPLTDEQRTAILALVPAVGVLIATALGRSQVTPMAKLERLDPDAARKVEQTSSDNTKLL